jgi:hypothetical protein
MQLVGSFACKDSGPNLSLDRLRQFEERFGVEIPREFGAFLMAGPNGGHPVPHYQFPIRDMDGLPVQWSALHGFYGIGTMSRIYDLEDSSERFEKLQNAAFPIGFDDLDGVIAIRTRGERIGEVLYQPWGDWPEDVENSLYFVADSFDGFLDALRVDG